MGQAALSFGKVAPLNFQPKPKDESNKLRRQNSLFEAIIAYLDALDEGPEGIRRMVDDADLKAAELKAKPEPVDDPRIAGMNKIADEVRLFHQSQINHQTNCV